jgi:hypothetical protein
MDQANQAMVALAGVDRVLAKQLPQQSANNRDQTKEKRRIRKR